MKSRVCITGDINLPLIEGEFSMIPFDLQTMFGIDGEFREIASKMISGIEGLFGTAFFTIHGKKLHKNGTLRRGGAHIDGNYDPMLMGFGGGGWKVDESGPDVNTELHKRQYCNTGGGIILASNYESCLGWCGEYEGSPNKGGDCSHLKLDDPFMLLRNTVYYGNNHFIHESLPVMEDVHRVMARITLPETHTFI